MKSLATPFNLTGGRIATTTDYSRIVEQKIMDVLVTGKLERPMMPLYGAGLQSLLFENVDDLVEADVKTDAALDILDSVSGIRILDLKLAQDSVEESLVRVTVVYQVSQSAPKITTFVVSTDVLTEETSL